MHAGVTNMQAPAEQIKVLRNLCPRLKQLLRTPAFCLVSLTNTQLLLCVVGWIPGNRPAQILHSITSRGICLASHEFITIVEGSFDQRLYL